MVPSALTKTPQRVLYLVSLTQFLGYGILYYTCSILILPIRDSSGWTEAQVSGAFSISLLTSGILSVPVGWWLDRFGPPRLLRYGSLLLPLLLGAVPFITLLPLFYLVWALIGACMALVLYETAFKIVAALPIKPERAFSTLTFLTGSSGLVFVPLGEWLVSTWTWQALIWLYALLVLLLVVPINLWLARETAAIPPVPRGASDYGWLKNPRAQQLVGVFFFNTFATSAVLVMGVVWLVRQGYTSAFAALALALIGAMSLPGRFTVTLVDRFRSPQHMLTWLVGLQLASLLLAYAVPGRGAILVFAVLFGFSLGSITPLRAFIIKAEYETVGLGVANGVIAFITTMARAAGPVLGGWMFTRGWDARWFTLLLAAFSIAALVLMLRRLHRQRTA